MKKLKAYGRIISGAMIMTWKHNLIDGFIIFTIFIQPLLVAILGLWMLEGKGGDYAIYVVVGSGMTGLWSSLLFISGNSVNMERWFGTLETLTGIPTPLQVIIFGKVLANVIQSILSMIGTYALVSVIFGYPLTVAMPFQFFVSLLMVMVSFIAFGLIIAPLFVLNPQIAQLQNGFEFPIFILSGFLFPILMLPSWTTPISWALPTYWAARALHAAGEGVEPVESIRMAWLILAGLSLLYFLASSGEFRFMIRKAKRDATLDTR